ncbi:histidine acid phosphatase [Xylaria bambusicola]|uniref:histidine acid phosphatase n=1 Tax=Xylaria bambusicola TaxID=326684 RepID=UPI0020078C45|nr:histidine acid phosphatase [Xylaria bambusicola]KAI0515122.1 histidine acid phosphatase [Xylaria bambusicola]
MGWNSWLTLSTLTAGAGAVVVDLNWHPPRNTSVNDLAMALHGSGVYGFIFNSSHTPDEQYGTYNWCNMPHVRRAEYKRAAKEYELRYVEVIQRHHKRTPYASNAFPVESYHWDCDDQGLYYYGAPFPSNNTDVKNTKRPAPGFWKGFTSPVNPFIPSGWIGTCQFPQITSPGLEDSYVHGEDLYGVYHELLGFLPARSDDADAWRDKVTYRVTNNVITSQVAGMLIGGTWRTTNPIPLRIAAAGIDSLEPQYPCATGSKLFNTIKSDAAWQTHLDAARDVYAVLDDISGVPPTDAGFHVSFDHYFDNLSARQCHAKPLPCKLSTEGNTSSCVDQALADTVYRLGQWEYSRMYRDAPTSLAASVASYGVWIAELAANLRAVITSGDDDDDEKSLLYRHNVAHDGSVSRVLSILQIEVMVWPGMGSEVVFELYERRGRNLMEREEEKERKDDSSSGYYVRVLFGGQVLRSSNPSLGVMDMLPVETLLAYFDGLVGENASLVVDKCNGSA